MTEAQANAECAPVDLLQCAGGGGALQMHLAQKVTAVQQARDHLGHDR
jgi:hypothetical protein